MKEQDLDDCPLIAAVCWRVDYKGREHKGSLTLSVRRTCICLVQSFQSVNVQWSICGIRRKITL